MKKFHFDLNPVSDPELYIKSDPDQELPVHRIRKIFSDQTN